LAKRLICQQINKLFVTESIFAKSTLLLFCNKQES